MLNYHANKHWCISIALLWLLNMPRHLLVSNLKIIMFAGKLITDFYANKLHRSIKPVELVSHFQVLKESWKAWLKGCKVVSKLTKLASYINLSNIFSTFYWHEETTRIPVILVCRELTKMYIMTEASVFKQLKNLCTNVSH